MSSSLQIVYNSDCVCFCGIGTKYSFLNNQTSEFLQLLNDEESTFNNTIL